MTDEKQMFVETDNGRKFIRDINVNISNLTVEYTVKDDKSEIYEICTFEELVNNDIEDIIPDSLKNTMKFEQELENLKVDLGTYWNIKDQKLIKLDYNCEYENLPYYIKLPFKSDLVDSKNITKTHDEDGKFISEDLKNGDIDLYELDRRQLYGSKNQNDEWEIFTLKEIEDRKKQFNEEKSKITYPTGFGTKYTYIVFFIWIILSPISTFLPSNMINNILMYSIVFYISPPGIQFVQINAILGSIKLEIKSLANCFIRKQYEKDTSFKLD